MNRATTWQTVSSEVARLETGHSEFTNCNDAMKTELDIRVLVIGKDTVSTQELSSFLQETGLKIASIPSESWCTAELDKVSPGVVIIEEKTGMESWSVSAQIRKESDVPIVLLGNGNTEMSWVRAAAYGVDLYMERPFSPRELVARVKTLARRYSSNR